MVDAEALVSKLLTKVQKIDDVAFRIWAIHDEDDFLKKSHPSEILKSYLERHKFFSPHQLWQLIHFYKNCLKENEEWEKKQSKLIETNQEENPPEHFLLAAAADPNIDVSPSRAGSRPKNIEKSGEGSISIVETVTNEDLLETLAAVEKECNKNPDFIADTIIDEIDMDVDYIQEDEQPYPPDNFYFIYDIGEDIKSACDAMEVKLAELGHYYTEKEMCKAYGDPRRLNDLWSTAIKRTGVPRLLKILDKEILKLKCLHANRIHLAACATFNESKKDKARRRKMSEIGRTINDGLKQLRSNRPRLKRSRRDYEDLILDFSKRACVEIRDKVYTMYKKLSEESEVFNLSPDEKDSTKYAKRQALEIALGTFCVDDLKDPCWYKKQKFIEELICALDFCAYNFINIEARSKELRNILKCPVENPNLSITDPDETQDTSFHKRKMVKRNWTRSTDTLTGIPDIVNEALVTTNVTDQKEKNLEPNPEDLDDVEL